MFLVYEEYGDYSDHTFTPLGVAPDAKLAQVKALQAAEKYVEDWYQRQLTYVTANPKAYTKNVKKDKVEYREDYDATGASPPYLRYQVGDRCFCWQPITCYEWEDGSPSNRQYSV